MSLGADDEGPFISPRLGLVAVGMLTMDLRPWLHHIVPLGLNRKGE